MDHSVYDVWVINCLSNQSAAAEKEEGIVLEGEGEVKDDAETAAPAIEEQELQSD